MESPKKAWHQHQTTRTIGWICALAAALDAIVWWFYFHPYVSTDDARVAATLVRVAPEGVGGRIEKVNVTEGSKVKQGDVLVELDHRLTSANLAKAKARADMTSHDLSRSQQLFKQNGMAQRDADKALAESLTAQADLQLAQTNDDNTTLRAPLNGVVIQKIAEVGNILEPGQTAVTVADVDHAWISANIEETAIGDVRIGQLVTVNVDEGGSLTGKVSEIREAAAAQFALIPSDNAAGNFTKLVQRIPIKVELDAHSQVLRPGQSVEIKIKVR